MSRLKRGRHAPAFVLLIIAQRPSYGLEILNQLNEVCPENTLDTAAIYRALKSLEVDEMITSQWLESETGAPTKVYEITEKGLQLLAEYKQDIEHRITHLNQFISVYNELTKKQ